MDILVTKRLTLRPPLEVDAEAITTALQNTSIARNLTHVPTPYAHQDALDWIKRTSVDEGTMYFSIYREKFLGAISVTPNATGEMDLGYWLDQPAWGQGFMTEAARAVVSHAFRKFSLETIVSGAYEDNRASQTVLAKLGFEPTGTATHSNPTRKCDVTCNRVALQRSTFEQLFGSLETNEAA